MHPNPIFRGEEVARHISFVRDRAFGTLAANGAEGPAMAHVPFLVSDDATTADLHLVRSNPIARMGDVPAVIAVTGPDAYISPDWYGVEDQVPTWNYVSVHLRGRLEPLPVEILPDMLARQSAAYENRLRPKTPWTMDKMTAETTARFLRMILPFRFHIETIDGTWKLGQNKDDPVRLAAADKVPDGLGSELAALADLMRKG